MFFHVHFFVLLLLVVNISLWTMKIFQCLSLVSLVIAHFSLYTSPCSLFFRRKHWRKQILSFFTFLFLSSVWLSWYLLAFLCCYALFLSVSTHSDSHWNIYFSFYVRWSSQPFHIVSCLYFFLFLYFWSIDYVDFDFVCCSILFFFFQYSIIFENSAIISSFLSFELFCSIPLDGPPATWLDFPLNYDTKYLCTPWGWFELTVSTSFVLSLLHRVASLFVDIFCSSLCLYVCFPGISSHCPCSCCVYR